jgi:hypothetical protein
VLLSLCLAVDAGTSDVSPVLNALQSQDFDDWQLVIAACSQEKLTTGAHTAALPGAVFERIETDPRIEVVWCDSSAGEVELLNLALKQARGRYVKIMTEHEILDPGALSIVAESLKDDAFDVITYQTRLRQPSQESVTISAYEKNLRDLSEKLLNLAEQLPVTSYVFRTHDKAILFDSNFRLLAHAIFLKTFLKERKRLDLRHILSETVGADTDLNALEGSEIIEMLGEIRLLPIFVDAACLSENFATHASTIANEFENQFKGDSILIEQKHSANHLALRNLSRANLCRKGRCALAVVYSNLSECHDNNVELQAKLAELSRAQRANEAAKEALFSLQNSRTWRTTGVLRQFAKLFR